MSVALAPVETTAESADAAYSDVKGYIDSTETQDMSHSDLEREIEERLREVARRLLQEHLDARGDGEALGEVTGADGGKRSKARVHTRQLETIFGTVEVDRLGYGAHGIESLHPKDASLNLPEERYSLEVRRRVAEEVARSSFEEAVAAVQRTTGARVPKRQAEELAQRAAQDFDAFYEQRRAESVADASAGEIMVVSFDGKGVVMRREDLRAATRKRAAKNRNKRLKTRLTRGEKRNAKRMAAVAAVYTVAPFIRRPEEIVGELAGITDAGRCRPRPEHKRVLASLEKSTAEVMDEVFADALHRDPDRTRTWVAMVDGDGQQLRLLKRLARKHQLDLIIVLDLIHVIEYLWKAGAAFHPACTPQLEEWVQKRLLSILRGGSSVVAAGMRRSATLRGLDPAARKPVDTCAGYLLRHRLCLRYDDYLARGLPIASGVIEGACRHLIKDRMDVTGARWSLTGAEAVLRLRALRSSNDFDEYWKFHEAQEYQRNHSSRYADGVVPEVKNPRRKRSLKAIK